MQSGFQRIKPFLLLAVLLLASCSSAVAATSPEEGSPLPSSSAAQPVSSVRTLAPAATPVVVDSILSADESAGEKKRLSPTPVLESALPSSLPSQPRVTVETPVPEFKVCSPIAGVQLDYLHKIISDPYRPPPPGSDDRHEGVDFSYYNLAGRKTFIAGVGIQSVLPGIVVAAITNSFPYGNFVIVETPHEWLPVMMQHRLDIPEGASIYLLYAHMQSAPPVSLGEEIDSCQVIGKVGHSGNSTVAHLHLEARRGGSGATFESMAAFQPTVTPEERANYKLWRTSGLFVHFDPMRVFEMQ